MILRLLGAWLGELLIVAGLLYGDRWGPLGEAPLGLAVTLVSLASIREPRLRWVLCAIGAWFFAAPALGARLPLPLAVIDQCVGLLLLAMAPARNTGQRVRWLGDRKRPYAFNSAKVR